ncbi:acyltransferase family protein [Nocardioides currus]|uniref:Acyltransferase n=1 Tax=Nocardioides currus TaxID=2133958 RepID=A0A2R7YZP5_9ACTN|nr:acyltransferase [Nocardioides currus]PUA81359.1 acyltransferase [Nocardioides currus]
MSTILGDQGHRANNFDALRLVGALMVMFAHAYALMVRPQDIPIVLGYPLQTLGVVIFFAISGYLITASFDRNRNPITYLLARSLRIFPALVVVVLLSAYVLGPMVTVLTREEYFAQPLTDQYVVNNIRLFAQFVLPGVWDDLPYPSAVNGSLWTLFVEFLCYLAAPLAFLFPRLLRPFAAIVAVFVIIHYAEAPIEESPIFWAVRLRDAAGLWVFFAGGAFIRFALQAWPWFKLRGDVAVVMVSAQTVIAWSFPDYALETAWLTLPYAVLTIGLARTPYVSRTARFGDFSYGLYLYAFPVQQLVIDQWGVHGAVRNFLTVLGITLVLAIASWHLVERPSLALKDKILHRRVRPGSAEPTAPAADREPESASA